MDKFDEKARELMQTINSEPRQSWEWVESKIAQALRDVVREVRLAVIAEQLTPDPEEPKEVMPTEHAAMGKGPIESASVTPPGVSRDDGSGRKINPHANTQEIIEIDEDGKVSVHQMADSEPITCSADVRRLELRKQREAELAEGSGHECAAQIRHISKELERLENWLSPDVIAKRSVEFSVEALNSMRAILSGLRIAVDAALAQSCPAPSLTRDVANYVKNLRFYADQARSNDWHTDGRVIEWHTIRTTLYEIANALQKVSGSEDTRLRRAAEAVCKFDWGMAMIGENYHAERVASMRELRAAIESETEQPK